MALTSPGVEVQVIDESFYTPAEPGTVPLIVVATAENKLNGAGTAVAAGTLASNAGKVFRISSQRELVETFGVPFFEKTATGNPVHGGERNEYALLAAYSLLGVSNSAFICRADVDLNELAGQTAEPGAEPRDGTWWINSAASAWGIQEWNNRPADVSGGQKFTTKFPIRLTDTDEDKISSGVPKASVGSIGDYCVVFQTVTLTDPDKELAKIFYKSPGIAGQPGTAGQWVLVGSTDWALSWPVIISTDTVDASFSGTIMINGVTVTGTNLSSIVLDINSKLGNAQGIYAVAVNDRLNLYSDGTDTSVVDSTTSGVIVIAAGTGDVIDGLKLTAGTYITPRVAHAPHTQRPLWKRSEATVLGSVPSGQPGVPTGSVWIKTTEPNGGARLRVSRWNSSTNAWNSVEAPMFKSTNEANFSLDRSTGGLNIDLNTLFTQYNAREYLSGAETGSTTAAQTAEFRVWRRRTAGQTVIVSSPVTASSPAATESTFTMKQSRASERELGDPVTVTVDLTGLLSAQVRADRIAAAINAVGSGFFDNQQNNLTSKVVASVSDNLEIVLTHTEGGDIRLSKGQTPGFLDSLFSPYNLVNGTGTVNYYDVADGLVTGSDDDFLITNWTPLAASTNPAYYVAPIQPLEEPNDGQLWYNPTVSEVDIMMHNGTTWVGYKHASSPYSGTDSNGPIVSASMPVLQSDGSQLVTGDLWISTADLENYPAIYKYDNDAVGASGFNPSKWVLVDKTDQTTEDGILFADARVNGTGTTNVPALIGDLLSSNFLDPDAPDPALYPKGMLLWNTRRSYGNVKRYANNYINRSQGNPRYDAGNSPSGSAVVQQEDMTDYATDRWVTASPNQEDGSGTFGRKAQRSVVVQRLKSVIDTSEEARDEERRNFNIIAAPGYPELLSNLINLNLDRKVTAFVIGDTPLRLQPNTTSLLNYATNAALAFDNGDDAIVSFDEYCAVYYPNGFTTDLSGTNAVVPASHMMLRTITLSDQVSYPWFAPAGTRRGGITNATSVGYLDSRENEFVTVALNTGQRDTLYEQKINPIPFFVGVGLVAFGQKTRARNASALDRINVARLVVYLRSQLQKLARPYIFEPNDKITRDEIKGAVESLLIELVGLRALYDFAVVCDESNNTPSRIDRNELWVDIAIEPVKAVEFIYIPLRLKNTGEI